MTPSIAAPFADLAPPVHPQVLHYLTDPCWADADPLPSLSLPWVEDGSVWDEVARVSASRQVPGDYTQFKRAIETLATTPMVSPVARAHQLRFLAALVATPDQILRWTFRSRDTFQQALWAPELLDQPWSVIQPFLAWRDSESTGPVTLRLLERYLRPPTPRPATTDPVRLAAAMRQAWVRLDVCDLLAREGRVAGWPAPLAEAMREGLMQRRVAGPCRWPAEMVIACGPAIIGAALVAVTTDVMTQRPESTQALALLQTWRDLPLAWWAELPLEEHLRVLHIPCAPLRELAIASFREVPAVGAARTDPVPTASPMPLARVP